ncbi:MAG: LON peptidase substrate-binding domain-containing protein [Leptospiraceae bacterium]|nr:LON peptidase substrate-binding domain-containing protein [Leptospiraceae bacterium]
MISTLPIFPLPSVILFPGTVLPLHIFEPRYRLMMDYCMENDDEIGITSINEKSEIESIFGWGRIITREALPDGRSNILVQGMGIAKLVRFQTHEPFIIANVEKRENGYSHLRMTEFIEILDNIIRLTRKYLDEMKADISFIQDLERIRNHPFPIEVITSFLSLDHEYKLDILATEDPFEKAIKLFASVKNLVRE